ncbi:hypothetical protein H4P46_12445 [Escherichia coli]|nr:hypothetical protein H4P46_12445 [Escherichia coli]
MRNKPHRVLDKFFRLLHDLKLLAGNLKILFNPENISNAFLIFSGRIQFNNAIRTLDLLHQLVV